MATRSDIQAGRATITLSLKQGDLVRTLKSVEARFRAMGEGLTSLGMKMIASGSAILVPFVAMTKAFTEAGDAAVRMAQRTGMTAESITQLTAIAKANEISIEEVEGGFRKFQKTLADASNGSKEANRKLLDLGLSVEQLAGMHPDDQFEAIAEAISKVEGPTNRAAAAMAVFGKSGTSLLPMLEGGSEGLKELKQKAIDMGLAMDAEAIQAAVELDDAMDDLQGSATGLSRSIGASLAPMMTELAKVSTACIATFSKFVREHGDLIRSIAKGTAAVVAGGSAFFVLGKMFVLAAGAVGFLSPAILALATPLGAVSALILGGAFAWLKWSDNGKKAASEIGGTLRRIRDYFSTLFGDIGDTASTTWTGVINAVSSGDLALAGEVAMAGLLVVWEKGTAEIRTMWSDTKWFFLTVWNEVTTSLAKGFFEAIGSIEKAWVNVIAVFGSSWDQFLANMLPSLSEWGGALEDTITNAMEAVGLLTKEGADRIRNSTAARVAEEKRAFADPAKKRIDDGEAKREEERKARLAAIDARTAALGKTLDEDKARSQKKLDDEAKAAVAARAKALTDAQKKLADLTAKSAGAAASAKSAFPGADEAGEELSKRGSKVAGSFFSAALFGLAGGAGDRTAKVAEKHKDIAKEHLEIAKRTLSMLGATRMVFQ